ncbi:hypothetical protein L596_003920 [Steinernema carpocapsae]|uniref:Uncharacterized protein n=1 Tax=Steinernema carpocapsae TaxID=34508 RepID=A0A4U8UV52_STECR|nr:hypothetical protein L596_003920 [Steinernema carpocapsae]
MFTGSKLLRRHRRRKSECFERGSDPCTERKISVGGRSFASTSLRTESTEKWLLNMLECGVTFANESRL